MSIPKYVISVWPKKPGGITDAVVKLTIGGAISIFPLKIVKGSRGPNLSLPKTNSYVEVVKSPVLFIDMKARKQVTRNIEKTYRPDKSTCREFNREQSMHLDYYVFPKEKSASEIATAMLEINHTIRIRGIRVLEFASGVRAVRFPEQVRRVKGDYEFRRIVDFRNGWEESITNEIWRAYDEEMARRKGKEVR